MLTAVPPVNPQAAKAATRTLAASNPDLVNPDGSMKPVDPSTPKGAAARQQWMQSYAANGGKVQVARGPVLQEQVQQARIAARSLPDKPPALAMVQCPASGDDDDGPQLKAAPAPPPVATPGQPCQPGDMPCKPTRPQLQCSHGRKPSTDNLLEVVPSEAGDSIALGCGASSCGKPPVWSISGHTHSEEQGTRASFNAERWLIRAVMGMHWAASFTPKSYRVSVSTECGAQSAEYTVRTYPSDKLAISVNGKEWAEMKSKIDYAIETVLSAYLVKPSFEWLVGKVDLGAGWEEDPDSHLAYYGWKVSASFDPLIGGKVRVPFGPLAAVPQWLKKYGDAYFFVEFSGGIGIVGEWGRTGPSKISGNLKGTGKIGGKIGGSMFFVGKSVIVMEVAGSSGISVEAAPDMDSYDFPAGTIEAKWDGLKAEVTVVAVRGIIELKREFNVCDARPLMEKTVYDLSQFAPR